MSLFVQIAVQEGDERHMTESQRTPPELFLLSHPSSEVVHAAYQETETLCHVLTWGEFERCDDFPEKRLCGNCSLMLEKRPFWRQTAFADAWLEHKCAATE